MNSYRRGTGLRVGIYCKGSESNSFFLFIAHLPQGILKVSGACNGKQLEATTASHPKPRRFAH